MLQIWGSDSLNALRIEMDVSSRISFRTRGKTYILTNFLRMSGMNYWLTLNFCFLTCKKQHFKILPGRTSPNCSKFGFNTSRAVFSFKFHHFNCIIFIYIEYCPFYALIGVRACSISFGFLQSCMAGGSLVHALPPRNYLLVFCCCWSHNICHFKSTLCHCLVFPAMVLLSSCCFFFCPVPYA